MGRAPYKVQHTSLLHICPTAVHHPHSWCQDIKRPFPSPYVCLTSWVSADHPLGGVAETSLGHAHPSYSAPCGHGFLLYFLVIRALENIYKLYKLPKDQRELRLNARLAPFIDGPVLVPRDEKTCLGSVAGFVSFHFIYLSCISFLPADVVKTPRLQGGQRTVCGSRFSRMQAPGVELPSNLLPPARLPPPKVPPSPNIGPLSGEQCSNP